MPALERGKLLAQGKNLQDEIVAGAKEGTEAGQNCERNLDRGQGRLGITLLANALKDHAVVFVAQPEPGSAKLVQLGTNRCKEPSLLGQTVDAGRSNDVGSRCNREPDSVAVVHQQRLGTKFCSEHDGFALARVQAGMAILPKRRRSSSKSPSAARYPTGLLLETTKGYPILRCLSNSPMALASASQSSAV